MTDKYVKEISKDEIRDLINRSITSSTCYSVEFETLQQAIDSSVESIYGKVNNFEVLTPKVDGMNKRMMMGILMELKSGT